RGGGGELVRGVAGAAAGVALVEQGLELRLVAALAPGDGDLGLRVVRVAGHAGVGGHRLLAAAVLHHDVVALAAVGGAGERGAVGAVAGVALLSVHRDLLGVAAHAAPLVD